MSDTILTNDTRTPPQAVTLGGLIFLLGLAALLLVTKPWYHPNTMQTYTFWAVALAVIIVSWLIGHSLKIAEQWERAVVLRLGAYRGLRGPGYFFIIPVYRPAIAIHIVGM